MRNLFAPISDHSPILLCTSVQEAKMSRRVFRFENKWKAEPGLNAVVEEVWGSGSGLEVLDKLQSCSLALDRSVFD